MIVRIWTAEATHEDADDYRRHFHEELMPKLRKCEGFVSAEALENHGRDVYDDVEFVIITRWENMDAIHKFTGAHVERAVIEPDVRAALKRYDETVKHYVHVAEER
jgi:heme-degrading monooxygenase HmoA